MFICIFIPFIALNIFNLWISTDNMEKMLAQNTKQMLAQVDMMLSFYMQNIENTMGIIEDTAFVKDFIGENRIPGTREGLLEFLGSVEGKYPEIAGILVISERDEHASNTIERISRDSLKKEDWYKRALASPHSYLLIGKPLGRNLRNASYGMDEIMSCVKAVWNPALSRFDGVLLLDFRLSAFEENIKNIILGSQGFLYVTDAEGEEIIYAPYNPVIHRIDNALVLGNGKEKTVVKVGSESYQVFSKRSENWNIMGVFPSSDVMAAVTQFQYIAMILLVCTAGLMLLFSNRINSMIIEPLGYLQSLMRSAENGDIDVRFPVSSEDEISSLGLSFNRMLSEIQKLLKIIDEKNEQKREAEFQILQEQIKPHFLYNTLDTVNWIAAECGATEIVKLVAALTKFFRLSLNKGKEYISVGNELEQVENYLIVQSIRYEDAFGLTVEADPELMGCMVLKLILQPLVENSIYHGIKERMSKEPDFSGKIAISVRRSGNDLELAVRDNGCGAEPELAEELNRMFGSGAQSVGFGLYNVNRRLKAAFGAGYGLSFRSARGQGAEVLVRHPILAEASNTDGGTGL
jgi:two-component system sensor histidine kinase YesM